MASGAFRIAGVNLPPNKHTWVALKALFGIGRSRALKICKATGVLPETLVRNLTADQEEMLRKAVSEYEIEGDLRRKIALNIKRLIDLKCFRGLRHIRGLPVRGQRTHTNAKTRKKRKERGGGRKDDR